MGNSHNFRFSVIDNRQHGTEEIVFSVTSVIFFIYYIVTILSYLIHNKSRVDCKNLSLKNEENLRTDSLKKTY